MPEPTDIDWPEDVLGCAARQGYRAAPGARFRTIEVQDGPNRLRLMQDTIKNDYTMQFNWSGAQLTAFSTFYFDTLNVGTRWFNMPVLTGLGMLPYVCHFAGPHSIAALDNTNDMFVVSFAVEAYAAAWLLPPALLVDDPVDAQSPDMVEGIYAYDAGACDDTLPTDIVNALKPKAYV